MSTGLAVGDRVLAIPNFGPGGFAESTTANAAGGVFPIPESMSFAAASALHVVYQTGHLALHRRAHLQAGETLLVHAGAGGVGSAAIQLGLAAGARGDRDRGRSRQGRRMPRSSARTSRSTTASTTSSTR